MKNKKKINLKRISLDESINSKSTKLIKYKNSAENKVSNKANNKANIRIRKERSGNKIVKIILVALIILLILAMISVLGLYLSHKNDVLARTDITATMNVSNYIGFNLDKDKVYFGSLFPGGSSSRDVNVNSSNDGYIYITSEGDFDNVVFVYAQNIPVQAGSVAMINFIAKPPRNMSLGNYEIPLHIYVLKKKASCLTKFLIQGKRVNLLSERIVPIQAKVSVNITRLINSSTS